MGLFARLSLAFGAFKGRAKIGALEGGLIYNIHHSGVDAPRVQHFISEIVTAAWNMRIIAVYFESMGFSFEDYAAMYRAAVHACPDRLIENKKLIATFIFIDNYKNLAQGLYSYSKAVSGDTGEKRLHGLEILVTSTVNDIVRYKGNELSPIANYPPLTK